MSARPPRVPGGKRQVHIICLAVGTTHQKQTMLLVDKFMFYFVNCLSVCLAYLNGYERQFKY